jgi:hypothetical protein
LSILEVLYALDRGFGGVEVTQAAEDARIETLRSGLGWIRSPDRTSGYDNNEGQPMTARSELNVGYPLGATAYFAYLARWRDSGDFAALECR